MSVSADSDSSTEKVNAGEVEVGSGSTTVTPTPTPTLLPIKKHPLKRTWTYWYLNDDRSAKWEDRLKPVCDFETVEDFFALYNNIRPPSSLNNTCDYNVFKKGIQPMWEVPENAQGGRWLINVDKSKPIELIDYIWLELLLAMIGEQFDEDMEQICGAVANVRNKGSKISLWTKDHNKDDSNMRVGKILHQKLATANVETRFKPLFDVLRYEDHDSCQRKQGSTVKAKLSISLHDLSPTSNR